MKNNLKIGLYVVGGLTLTIGGLLAYDNFKKAKSNNTEPNKGEDTDVDSPINSYALDSGFNAELPIGTGSKGISVYVVQSALIKLGQNIPLNGIWDDKTFNAVSEVDGWGYGYNSVCSFTQRCTLSLDNYNELIKRAISKGLDYDKTVAKAKLYFK